ncbi:MAG TPA: hypothetical protein VM077_03510 [Candidatus Limnocylindrales bacterium]|nr:hypothetical protein [Candidatus Limnocylindrales bacterium]
MTSLALKIDNVDRPNMNAAVQQLPLSQEKIITPLAQVLDESLPVSAPKPISQSLKQSLDDLFPEQEYDGKIIQEAKKALGPMATQFSENELKDTVTKVQFLAESWLDDFEREIFEGKTLNELLHEKGGL